MDHILQMWGFYSQALWGSDELWKQLKFPIRVHEHILVKKLLHPALMQSPNGSLTNQGAYFWIVASRLLQIKEVHLKLFDKFTGDLRRARDDEKLFSICSEIITASTILDSGAPIFLTKESEGEFETSLDGAGGERVHVEVKTRFPSRDTGGDVLENLDHIFQCANKQVINIPDDKKILIVADLSFANPSGLPKEEFEDLFRKFYEEKIVTQPAFLEKVPHCVAFQCIRSESAAGIAYLKLHPNLVAISSYGFELAKIWNPRNDSAGQMVVRSLTDKF